MQLFRTAAQQKFQVQTANINWCQSNQPLLGLLIKFSSSSSSD